MGLEEKVIEYILEPSNSEIPLPKLIANFAKKEREAYASQQVKEALEEAEIDRKRLISELQHVTIALKTVQSFGATIPIIENAQRLVDEIKSKYPFTN